MNPHQLRIFPGSALALPIFFFLVSGCSAFRDWFAGEAPQEQRAIDQPDPQEYVLVRNPRYSAGATSGSPYEPEYVWTKRKDAPFNLNAFIRGKKVAEASAKDEEQFASARPPEAMRPPRADDRFFLPPSSQKRPISEGMRRAEPLRTPAAMLRPAYGYVVFSRGEKVYTDLGSESGATVGNILVIYREGQELKHPVTGVSLGYVDDEVAQARIAEVGEK